MNVSGSNALTPKKSLDMGRAKARPNAVVRREAARRVFANLFF